MTGSAVPCTLAPLANAFERFATRECRGASPLYEQLALGIARDVALLDLAARATSQPVPNLFFGAVHFLLRRHAQDPLASFYLSLTADPDLSDPMPAFRTFCLQHADCIRRILEMRRVQTNEVRRCTMLLPAFGLVAEQAKQQPLALVEIGASAGLNLLWDRYGYTYGTGQTYGDPDAPVQLRCMLRGDRRPRFPRTFPAVASRLGIDLQPIDVRDPDQRDWLRALIWPEHVERVELLDRAVALTQHDPPHVCPGDALELLPGILAATPHDRALCLFHSFVVNQFSAVGRGRLAAILDLYGVQRDLYCISIAAVDTAVPQLRLISYRDGTRQEQLLAMCSDHGTWLEWRE